MTIISWLYKNFTEHCHYQNCQNCDKKNLLNANETPRIAIKSSHGLISFSIIITNPWWAIYCLATKRKWVCWWCSLCHILGEGQSDTWSLGIPGPPSWTLGHPAALASSGSHRYGEDGPSVSREWTVWINHGLFIVGVQMEEREYQWKVIPVGTFFKNTIVNVGEELFL